MESLIHLHIFGPDASGGSPRSVRLSLSPSIPVGTADELEARLHYGLPEQSNAAPPPSWTRLKLSGQWSALARAFRPTHEDGRGSPLVAVSALFHDSLGLCEQGQLVELSEDRRVFPPALDRVAPAADDELQLPPPARRNRTSAAFTALLELAAVAPGTTPQLIAGVLSVALGTTSLRGIVLALPPSVFTDSGLLLRGFSGLLASAPADLRGRIEFTTYQDSPAPRPLTVMAIPDNHRCIPRLIRSGGFGVLPHQQLSASLLAPHAVEYANQQFELLNSGAFEEAQALAATFKLIPGESSLPEKRGVALHADLLRLAERPAAKVLVNWLADKNLDELLKLQESRESDLRAHEISIRRLLFEVVGKSMQFEAARDQHNSLGPLLSALGERWPDPADARPHLPLLKSPLLNFLRSWRETAGWAPMTSLLEEIDEYPNWLRELLVTALAETVALGHDPAARDETELLGRLEAQYGTLPRAVPPPRYLSWWIHEKGLGDGRVKAHVARMASSAQGQEALFRLLASFDSPEDSHFIALLRHALPLLIDRSPGVVVALMGDLLQRFERDERALTILEHVFSLFSRVEHANDEGQGAVDQGSHSRTALAEIVVGLLLPIVPGGPEAIRHTTLLKRAADLLPTSCWATITDTTIRAAADSEDPEVTVKLRNLRRLWSASLCGGHRPSFPSALAQLSQLHAARPSLALDPSPHQDIIAAGGLFWSATLAVDDTLLLLRALGDDYTKRHWIALFALYERLGETMIDLERALLAAVRAPRRPAAEQALVLWWLWFAAHEFGWTKFATHTARLLIWDNLLPSLSDEHFERLCRLLPTETGFSRARLVAAAVEGALLSHVTRLQAGMDPAEPTSDLFRHFSRHADQLSPEVYGRLVTRYWESCFERGQFTTESLRLFIDQVFVPRHWEVLAARFKDFCTRRPGLRYQLHGLRRTTLGRRLPRQLLGEFDTVKKSSGQMSELLEP